MAWVLAFHLWPDVVRGGWLGVGLFFTLSGYLIAGLLDAELARTGRLRLGRFMERRARRLLPAALVTIAGALALTALVDDQPLRTVSIDALSAALNVFNWHAALDDEGYAAIFEAMPAPLAHFWSLAIEEQFYLVFPAAVALTRRPGLVVSAMAGIGLGGVALWWGSTDAYVATPVRALEIAVGAGLALAQARCRVVRRLFDPRPTRGSAARVAWTVLVMVAAAVAALSVARLGPEDDFVFRGGPQLMALCWAVLVVAAAREDRPGRFLWWKPLRWLGLRSYAVYLFHWPLIELTRWHPAVVIAVTLAAAEVSFHLLEMPVRRGVAPRQLALLVASAAALVTASATIAAASTPARGVAERAQGADELPAWLTERQAPSVRSSIPADDLSSPSMPSRPKSVDRPESGHDAPRANATTLRGPDASRAKPLEAAEPQSTAQAPEPPELKAPAAGPNEVTAPDAVASPPDAVASPPEVSPPRLEPTVPIVTVLGDSAALYLADGLREWGDATRRMAVVDHSRIGCSPVAASGSGWLSLRGELDGEAHPSGFVEGLPCRDDHIMGGSGAVLVVDHGAVLFDHQHADGTWESVLDQRLSDDIADSYRRLVEKARRIGARVIFATAPRLLPTPGRAAADQPQTSPERADAYNALLRDLVEYLSGTDGVAPAGLIDTAAVLDEHGYHGVYGRSDGMHLDYDRAEAFAADVLGPALLALLAVR